MVTTDQGGVRRRRQRVKLTYARLLMDEVEFKMVYNSAVNAVQAGDHGRALLFILQMLNGMQETITDMQQDEGDEC